MAIKPSFTHKSCDQPCSLGLQQSSQDKYIRAHKSIWLTSYRQMKYRVHRIEVKSDNMQEKLEQFINKLDGEVISIIPDIRPTFQLMGATAKIDFLLIVEKTA